MIAPLPEIRSLPAAAPARAIALPARWVACLRLLGWRIVGHMPNRPKVIVCAAPHTSNWDFVIAMLAVLALGVRASYLMKQEAFIWPLAGLFKWLGGVPVARAQAGGMVASLVAWFAAREQAWLLITPEGTRQKVARYKTGFLRVATESQVPVVLVAWDYPSKRLIIEKVWTLTGDHEADCAAIRQYLNNRYVARHPKWQ